MSFQSPRRYLTRLCCLCEGQATDICMRSACVGAGDIKRARHWQRDLRQDFVCPDQCDSLQWNRRFSPILTILIPFIPPWKTGFPSSLRCGFLCHCLADLNCLTMTFNESSPKTKNNTAVSLDIPLALYIFSWTVSFQSYVPSWFYFEILRGRRFGPAALRSALWRVELSLLYWTEILAGPTRMCRGENVQTELRVWSKCLKKK